MWHSDSRRLAVSSRSLKAVVVFDAVKREPLVCLDHLERASIQLAFPPLGCGMSPDILIVAEDGRNYYLAGKPNHLVCRPS